MTHFLIDHLRPVVYMILLSISALPPFVARAQGDSDFSYLYLIVDELKDLIALLVPVLIAVALAIFLWGLVVFIFQADSDQARASGRSRMIWGIIILFVAVSVWGIVALLGELTGIESLTISAPDASF